MKLHDHLDVGQNMLEIRGGELQVANSRELCWTAGSQEWCPKDASDIKLVFQEDGRLALSALQSTGIWKPYWWTDNSPNKGEGGSGNFLTCYDTEPYLDILDTSGHILWQAMIKGHTIRSGAQEQARALPAVAKAQTPPTATSKNGMAFMLSPAAAPGLVLEAAAVSAKGTASVYPASAKNELNQKWIFESKQQGLFAISPVNNRAMVLTVAQGQGADGTKVIMMPDRGYNTQRWTITKEGAYVSLHPACNNSFAMDNAGGPQTPVDLLHYVPGNLNTLWLTHAISF